MILFSLFLALTGTRIIADADISSPVWKQLPTTKQLEYIYPMGEPDALPGTYSVQLRCQIIDKAGRVRCISVGESPSGFGCGDRAATTFSRYAIVNMIGTKGARVGKVALVTYKITPG